MFPFCDLALLALLVFNLPDVWDYDISLSATIAFYLSESSVGQLTISDSMIAFLAVSGTEKRTCPAAKSLLSKGPLSTCMPGGSAG